MHDQLRSLVHQQLLAGIHIAELIQPGQVEVQLVHRAVDGHLHGIASRQSRLQIQEGTVQITPRRHRRLNRHRLRGVVTAVGLSESDTAGRRQGGHHHHEKNRQATAFFSPQTLSQVRLPSKRVYRTIPVGGKTPTPSQEPTDHAHCPFNRP